MENKILVETSAHHLHLTQEDYDYLMGAEAGQHLEPEVRKTLSQPGQYVSTARFDLTGPINPKTGQPKMIKGVSFLGPVRKFDQVELSATDSRSLGVAAPLRESGDIAGSASVKISNPANGRFINIKEGCIVAKRHVHMTPEDAEAFHVKNGDIVSVLIKGTGREVIFGDTVIRVSPKFSLAMHIDTDESNAALAAGVVYGCIVPNAK